MYRSNRSRLQCTTRVGIVFINRPFRPGGRRKPQRSERAATRCRSQIAGFPREPAGFFRNAAPCLVRRWPLHRHYSVAPRLLASTPQRNGRDGAHPSPGLVGVLCTQVVPASSTRPVRATARHDHRPREGRTTFTPPRPSRRPPAPPAAPSACGRSGPRVRRLRTQSDAARPSHTSGFAAVRPR